MQPVIIEDTISIAAGTTNDNVIVSNASLRRYLNAPFPAVGKLLAVCSVTGLRISLDYGSKNVVADSDLRAGSDIQEPNDILNDEWHVSEGDQLVLKANNPTGGAITLQYRIVLDPLAEPGQMVELPPDVRTQQRGPVAIANGTVDQQLLNGLRYERPPIDSILEIFMTASALGLTRTLDVETQSIAPPSAIPPLNRIPLDPFDNMIAGVEVPQRDLILLAVTNRSGGPLNVFWRQRLRELART